MWLLFVIACTPEVDEPSATQGQFRVLTYNVHGLQPSLSDYPIAADERLPQISPLLTPYQLVGLQELFTEDYQDLVTANHDFEDYYDVRDDGVTYGAGLATFVDLADLGALAGAPAPQAFDACHGWLDSGSDCFANKGWQSVIIDLAPDQRLAVLNTHHDASSAEADQQARLDQVEQVLAYVDTLPANMPIVFMGDFNLKTSRELDLVAIDRYRQAGLISACERVGCDDSRIDKILIRDGQPSLQVDHWQVATEFVDANGQDLSDHLPVTATISWNAK